MVGNDVDGRRMEEARHVKEVVQVHLVWEEKTRVSRETGHQAERNELCLIAWNGMLWEREGRLNYIPKASKRSTLRLRLALRTSRATPMVTRSLIHF